MVYLAGATDARVERLRGLAIPLQGVGIQQVPTCLRQGESTLVVPKIDGLDKPLVSEMVHCARVDFEFLLGYSESPDSGQRAAVIAIQLEETVAIDDQLALLAARQVEVVHQAVARIVIIPVAVVVHARPVRRRDPARRIRADHPIECQTSPRLAGCCCLGCP